MDEAAARDAFAGALASYEQDFGTFFLARLLALDITYPGETCRIAFPIPDFLYNPQGTLHGGIIATILDISMGHLLRNAYGAAGITLEMKLQYLGAMTTNRGWCEARFLQKGKSIAFLESRMFNGRDELCAVATSTWKARSADKAPPPAGPDRAPD